MKIYIATKTDNYKDAQIVRDVFLNQGHEITFDWTETVAEVGPDGGLRKDTPSDEEFRRTCAENDVLGVTRAEAILVLAYPGLCGTLIEVGMAIAFEKPVFIMGQVERDSVFFALPGVYRIPEGAAYVPFVVDGTLAHYGI